MSLVLQTDMQETGEPKLVRVGFSLGANLGDRLATLERVCDYLSELFGSLRLSQVYETEPEGCPAGSPSYLNACVEVSTTMAPQAILRCCQEIEKDLGRTRSGEYGEPRTCDIDILYYGETITNTPELVLPHPRAHLREFVLRPLCDIDPLLVLPGQQATVQELLLALPKTGGVLLFPL